MKEVIKKIQINILIQESSIPFIKKHLRQYLKKYNYKIYSFFLDVEFKDAVKRDIKREKPAMNIAKYKNKDWKKIKAQPNKGDIIINTSNKSIKEVVNFILKEIGEKRRKHPKANWIRKSW